MSVLKRAKPIKEMGQRNLWVVYGRSGSGKTHFSSTFPKPALYVQIGDDGSNTIQETPGIDAVSIDKPSELKTLLGELREEKKYATVIVDTFSLFVNDWINENVASKGKKMTLQNWGELKTETEELVKYAHILAGTKIVVLICHENQNVVEGVEDEVLPEIRPSVSKGAMNFLEGMANYGIHCTILSKTKIVGGKEKVLTKHVAHIGPNPYYWVKTQKSAKVVLPEVLPDPTYLKIKKLLGGE